MELSEQAYNFSQLILKHYEKKIYPAKQETQKTSEKDQQIEKVEEQKNPTDKYSLNYSKFDPILKEQEKIEKEVKQQQEKQFDPMQQQFGASLDRRKERQLYEKPTEEKLSAAETFKLEGNKAIKEKDWEKAAYFYAKGLLQLDYTFPEGELQDKKFEELKENLHCNMSLVKYYQKDHDEALIQIYQVLKANPKNIKAKYRKALILFERDQYDESEKLLNQILQDENNSQESQNLLKKIAEKRIEYKLKEKSLVNAIFKKF